MDPGASVAESGPSDPEPLAVEVAPATLAALPAGLTADQVERGRELFAVCAVCHGLDARGTALGPDLRDAAWIGISGSPEEIAAVVRRGVPEPGEFPVPMPEMGGGAFVEEEVEALAAYVHALSLGPPPP